MKITRKRILALNLAFLMLLTLLLPASAADGTAKKVEITLNANGGLLYANGNEAPSYTYLVNAGEQFDLLNRFYKTGAYVDYFEDENKKIYTTYVVPSENMTLTAHWKVTDCVTPIVFFPDQPGKDITVVNGGEEWTVPDMTGYVNSDGTVETTFICWENEISGRWTTLLPGQKQPAADRPVSYRASYLSDQTGIIFCAGDETFAGNDGKSVLGLSSITWASYWESETGKKLVGWHDEEGNFYGPTDVTVPAAKTGWVRLHAQWASEDAIELRLISASYQNGVVSTVAKPGETVELPKFDSWSGQKFIRWSGHCETPNGYQELTVTGNTVTIPKDAQVVIMSALWLPEEKLVINGQSFTISEKQPSIRYRDENNQIIASFTYEMGNASARLTLWDYNGGAISLPCSTKVISNDGCDNVITATKGPALSAAGTLGLYTYCDDDKHASLTVNGAPATAAVQADSVILGWAQHTTLLAGEGGTVFEFNTEDRLFDLGSLNKNLYKLPTDADYQELTVTENAEIPAEAVAVSIEPKNSSLTVNGNGGKTADGKDTRVVTAHNWQNVSIGYLGFTNPGYYCTGYTGDGYNGLQNYDITICRDDEITLNWYKTGYNKYLALDLEGLRVTDTFQSEYQSNDGLVAFLDYENGEATLPDVQFKDGYTLLYWRDRNSENIYVPGETVKEADVPAGTVLTVSAWGSEKNLRYVFYANGKLFGTSGENGSKYMLTGQNYLPELMATDGSTVLYYTTSPDGSGEHYAAGSWNDDLPKGTKLYAQWLQEGSIITRITDGANNTLDRRSMKPGETLTLPTPNTPAGLKFAYWECNVVCRDNSGTVERHQPGETIAIPENAFEGNITAVWTLDGPVTIDGKEIEISNEKTDQAGDGWSIWFNQWFGMVHLTLDGYSGGSISLPSQTCVHMEGEHSMIKGTLRCEDRLGFSTTCAYGQHSGLTVQADDGQPAVISPHVYFSSEPDAEFGRAPHIKLTAGANARAFASPTDTLKVTGNKMVAYYGRTDSAEATALTMDEQGVLDVEDLQMFYTEAQMSRLTLDGAGGKTAAGKTSTTVDLEYGEGYSLRATGFKKQYSDVVGFVENTGTDTYYYYEWPKSIRVQSPAVTLKINWQELGYPYLAFRGNGLLTGPGVTSEVRVSYANKNKEREVLASDYVYADAVSNGDLVYWFSSEDGTETDSSRQYLAGEVVSEPDDTTLYARAIRSGQVALVAPGTTFSNGRHIVISSTLDTTLTSKEGKEIEGWNTEPDGTGRTYSFSDKLEYETPRILYAQWKTKLKAAVTETTTTETVVTFTPKAGESVRIEATNENDAAVLPEQARRVILAAYRNGQFLGMLPATAETGKIICRIPNDAKYDGCELKLFFMEGGKPKQDMEIIRLPAQAE